MSLYFVGFAGRSTGFGASAPASADAAETKYSVVLFPVDLSGLPKIDKCLYALAIIAKDAAPRSVHGELLLMPSYRPPRVRRTGLEYAFA